MPDDTMAQAKGRRLRAARLAADQALPHRCHILAKGRQAATRLARGAERLGLAVVMEGSPGSLLARERREGVGLVLLEAAWEEALEAVAPALCGQEGGTPLVALCATEREFSRCAELGVRHVVGCAFSQACLERCARDALARTAAERDALVRLLGSVRVRGPAGGAWMPLAAVCWAHRVSGPARRVELRTEDGVRELWEGESLRRFAREHRRYGFAQLSAHDCVRLDCVRRFGRDAEGGSFVELPGGERVHVAGHRAAAVAEALLWCGRLPASQVHEGVGRDEGALAPRQWAPAPPVRYAGGPHGAGAPRARSGASLGRPGTAGRRAACAPRGRPGPVEFPEGPFSARGN